MSGWIKLHRKLTDWEWYSDVNTTRVFLHLLLVANHKDNKWRGIDIKRGQRLTSLSKLADETNLSVKNIRTAIKRLKSTHEVASHSTAQHTVFTVVNYDSYQGEASEAASEGQTNGKQGATNKNDKNDKNENKDMFNKFWGMYGKKTSRAKCESKFNKLGKSDIEKIFEVLPDYVASTPNVKFRKDPATWLNGKCWNDEIQKSFDMPIKCNIDFSLLASNFNEAMANWEGVPEVIKVTDKQKEMISILERDFAMTDDRFKAYFNHIATSEKFRYFVDGVNIPPQNLTFFLKEDTIQR